MIKHIRSCIEIQFTEEHSKETQSKWRKAYNNLGKLTDGDSELEVILGYLKPFRKQEIISQLSKSAV